MARETLPQQDSNRLCSLAHWQIEAMCHAMLKAAQSHDTEALPYLVQSLSIRICDLNGALMTMVGGDDADAPKYLHDAVFGPRMEVAHV